MVRCGGAFGKIHSPARNHVDRRPLFIALGGFACFCWWQARSLEALALLFAEGSNVTAQPRAACSVSRASRLLARQLGYTGSTLFLLAAMAAGWSVFSGMSWLWAFERLGATLEFRARLRSTAGSIPGAIASIGREVAQQREVVVEEEKRRVELHEPIIIEPPKPEVPVSKKAEKPAPSREKQTVDLFPEAIIGGQLPPLHLLDPAPPATETVSAETLEYTSRLIERKLADFGVQVKVLAAMPGPVITRYEIEPAVGVKGAQIVNLARDLARALAMVSIRVVETVPGKSCMALELPNPQAADGQALRDHFQQALQRHGQPADGLPRQGHRRSAGRCRPGQDAAPAGRRDDRLGQVGRRQCDDPLHALQVGTGASCASSWSTPRCWNCPSTKAFHTCWHPSSPT
jgi:S-DNA-T family DNA segregation ATPase FtsK/SpoIIIE